MITQSESASNALRIDTLLRISPLNSRTGFCHTSVSATALYASSSSLSDIVFAHTHCHYADSCIFCSIVSFCSISCNRMHHRYNVAARFAGTAAISSLSCTTIGTISSGDAATVKSYPSASRS